MLIQGAKISQNQNKKIQNLGVDVSSSPVIDKKKYRIRDLEKKSNFLLQNGQYQQCLNTFSQIELLLRDFYKITPKTTSNLAAMRSINKARKKQQLIVLHNRTVVYKRQEQISQSLDHLVIIIDQITNMIQSDQVRLGFLEEHEEDQKNSIYANMNEWKIFVIKYYYYFASISLKAHQYQNGLAAIYKANDLIRQLYTYLEKMMRKHSRKGQDDIKDWIKLEQISDLKIICDLEQNICNSKHLSKITVSQLLQVINLIITMINEDQDKKKTNELSLDLQLQSLISLELVSPEEIAQQTLKQEQQMPSMVQFELIKLYHYLCLYVAGEIYSKSKHEIEMEYLKLKNSKNQIFSHSLTLLIYQKYLQQHWVSLDLINSSLKDLYRLNEFQAKTSNRININFFLDLFEIKEEDLYNYHHREMKKSYYQNTHLSIEELNKIQQKERKKPTVKTLHQDKRQESTSKKMINRKKQTGHRQHIKQRQIIRQQYQSKGFEVKPKGKVRDFLFEVVKKKSSSKTKTKPSDRSLRHIRSETTLPIKQVGILDKKTERKKK